MEKIPFLFQMASICGQPWQSARWRLKYREGDPLPNASSSGSSVARAHGVQGSNVMLSCDVTSGFSRRNLLFILDDNKEGKPAKNCHSHYWMPTSCSCFLTQTWLECAHTHSGSWSDIAELSCSHKSLWEEGTATLSSHFLEVLNGTLFKRCSTYATVVKPLSHSLLLQFLAAKSIRKEDWGVPGEVEKQNVGWEDMVVWVTACHFLQPAP